MHKALREVLGDHVQQKGSLVNSDRTRFDFAHNAPVTNAEILEIESRVNAEILGNAAATARVMEIEAAKATGAMMLFGEKYGDTVRVLEIGTSKELCGGTHVQRTGDIGLFKIIGESGIASGVRRIEAVTGMNALHYFQTLENTVDAAAQSLKTSPAELGSRLEILQLQMKALTMEVSALKGKLASSQTGDLIAQAIDVRGAKLLVAKLEGLDSKGLQGMIALLKDKLQSGIVVLAAVDAGKVQLAVGVSSDMTAKVKAGELVNFVAGQVGGKGGGKPDLAMAGGTDASQLAAALQSVNAWVAAKL
jgi:alanyl-tRNA synthetase